MERRRTTFLEAVYSCSTLPSVIFSNEHFLQQISTMLSFIQFSLPELVFLRSY